MTRLKICIFGTEADKFSRSFFDITRSVVFSKAEIFSFVGVLVKKLVKEEMNSSGVAK